MDQDIKKYVCKTCRADEVIHVEEIQSLWSGYGKIVRLALKGCKHTSVVVKHVKLPNKAHHPRGWNTDRSHQRKVHSYKVESNWYLDWLGGSDNRCRMPGCLALTSTENEFLMVLEDLDQKGYPRRKDLATQADMFACLKWLANFHGKYMGNKPEGLWETGSYWHLDTRPDELDALTDNALKSVAAKIDQALRNTRFQTIIHGDAKLANFCFSEAPGSVAAVDFQYAGGGCGMKDVAYFIGSCLNDVECENHESVLLDYYFFELHKALSYYSPDIDIDAVEHEWRHLYPIAWTDFHRFLKGWSPGHWKIHSYSERLAGEVIAQFNSSVF